jgi:hypothetical protein
MKTAAAWGALGAAAGTIVPVDADGLPTAFPAGALAVNTMIQFDPGQTYELTYTASGKAHIQVNSATVISDAPGKITFHFNGPDPFAQINIFKDGAWPAGIHIVRQDRVTSFAKGEKFAPDMLAQLKGFSPLRAMDWLATNGSTRTDLRLTDTKGSYANGVPIAVIVNLANKTGARPWINLPHLITDTKARALFAHLKTNLKPGILPVIEYSNEMWNWGFVQTTWAQKRPGANNDPGRWYGLRSGQLAIIARAYGFKLSMFGQFVQPDLFANNIYPGFKASGALDSDVEAIGAADYVAGTLNDQTKPDALALLAANDIDGALANLRAQVETDKPIHNKWGAIAKAHGWKYWTYEGANFHLNTLGFGDKMDALAAFYAKVQMDARAADVISAETDAFQAAGGEIEVPYDWANPSGRGGFFGLIGTPTLEMMQARIAANAPVARIADGLAALPQ